MYFANSAVAPVASLPWYDLPEVRPATDAVWKELSRQLQRTGLPEVPRRLNRETAYDRQWTSPGFLFGQACGYDVRIAYAGQLQVVATPCYDVPGCDPAGYRSYVVVREESRFEAIEDLRGCRCVINTPTSHSGMNVLRALVAPLHSAGRFFAAVHVSGSHERSLRMVRRGEADVAAIDCVTCALLKQYRPAELGGIRILYRTRPAPAPPYVTAASTSPAIVTALRNALLRALEQPSLAEAKRALLLTGIKVLPAEAYRPIELLHSLAHRYNYDELPGRVLAAG